MSLLNLLQTTLIYYTTSTNHFPFHQSCFHVHHMSQSSNSGKVSFVPLSGQFIDCSRYRKTPCTLPPLMHLNYCIVVYSTDSHMSITRGAICLFLLGWVKSYLFNTSFNRRCLLLCINIILTFTVLPCHTPQVRRVPLYYRTEWKDVQNRNCTFNSVATKTMRRSVVTDQLQTNINVMKSSTSLNRGDRESERSYGGFFWYNSALFSLRPKQAALLVLFYQADSP